VKSWIPENLNGVSIDAANATITDVNGRVSNIIIVDVQAANGVVHAINKVLLSQL